METLTDRRISSAAQAVLQQVEEAYETVFEDRAAGSAFFEELEDAHSFYQKRTAARPLGVHAIKLAQRKFRDSCRTIMRKARKDAGRRDED